MAKNKTEAQSRQVKKTLIEKLSPSGVKKQAIDTVNRLTRAKRREDGFDRRVMPPLQINNDELNRQVDTDNPVRDVDKEPDSSALVSILFATLHTNVYIRGPRYRVMFDRIVTRGFSLRHC
jgi:hypothetical protein